MTTTGTGLARVAVTDRPPSLAGTLATSTPEAVGRDLARALATQLCRGRGHPARGACADCEAAGRVLAGPGGRALFATRRGNSTRRLTAEDYYAIGVSLEVLGAGVQRVPGQRDK